MGLVEKKQGDIPKIRIHFTAEEPAFSFSDIVLSNDVREQIREYLGLIDNIELIFDKWNLKSVIRYPKRTLNLFGPSGTGKTMCAQAIAAHMKKKIILVDYSQIESKYVGETSKNLVDLFKYAESSDSVIVFDEADALLSKRVTLMQSATDVSVNQTRNVLLKLLDSYTYPVIFTTNFMENYDRAFGRRLLFNIEFKMPDKIQRHALWSHYLLKTIPFEGDYSECIDTLANIDNLTGADIANAVLHASINAAINKKKISVESLNAEVKKILVAKEKDDVKIESRRKISPDYAKKMIGD